ncbi:MULTISPECIES: hypothetical protein [Paenarthrobacter]|jgi:hypothetical protein|uniref:Membrane protein n=1 Tax=Paenarthrobacter nicotinovorans TaxID=29320 RepID=A0ABT9TSB1_PAENI|nr:MULTISPECIES: hypothetical protein [Paenarthrobacter]KQQ98266.1 hypothetical protein ASF74_14025 [Arthrobacter sp. Leaf145]BCW08981.1 hypothetical protein NtRootA2_02630 [Arthrobacter sp. NtRootA2]BCW13061.1 hypothetical protein NtRootA4_00400 [Arthrobacter sp. NtRootA4]BCW21397.1 hypothetical protein NtRootC7_02640 [Arthrobacter sp. NtRootC7]BCW25664.1 hypothetical protein NtRootC45_02640 [Arthrobacter sp. NtRootC45]BCW29933.1 hypothetical protein NtRootD5_02640 [Arthrobacter sp. NtRootD5
MTQSKAFIPLIAVLGALVAIMGGLTAMLAATGNQPVLFGLTLAIGMILLVVLGIFIGLLRKRS